MSDEYFELDKQRLNLERVFEEITKSREFNIILKDSQEQFKELSEKLDNNEITSLDFLLESGKILSEKYDEILAPPIPPKVEKGSLAEIPKSELTETLKKYYIKDDSETPAEEKTKIYKPLEIPSTSTQKEGDILTIEKSEGRRHCPKCQNEDKNFIRETIDKTNIIFSYPKMYGKKYHCGKCGTIWRER